MIDLAKEKGWVIPHVEDYLEEVEEELRILQISFNRLKNVVNDLIKLKGGNKDGNKNRKD